MLTLSHKTRKEEILDAACNLFMARGYVSATMRDIADEVGIEAASLYNHIDSKSELLKEICFKVGHQYLEGMEGILESSMSPVTKVESLLELHLNMITTSQMAIVAEDEWRHLTGEALRNFVEMRNNYESQFLKVINEGQQKGEIKKLNPEVILFTLLSSMRWLQSRLKKSGKANIHKTKQEISALLLEGLRI